MKKLVNINLKNIGGSVRDEFKSKAFKFGGYSTAISIVALCIVIAVNLLVSALPTTITKLDVSRQQLYTLSEQTRQIVSRLNEKVDLCLIAQSGNENSLLTELLNRYAALGDKVSFSVIDPAINPNFTSQYTSDKVDENSVIVVGSKRSKVVKYSQIFELDYEAYYYQNIQTYNFNGEGMITSAIDYVTAEKLPLIYVLKGHGEMELNNTFETAVSNQNMKLEDLSLITADAVPEDADCLFIISPKSDISPEEAEKIIAYLEGGGSVMLITDYWDTEMPNLNSVTENYGLTKINGLVLENDGDHYTEQKYNLVPDKCAHEITQPLLEARKYVVIPYAHAIAELDSCRSTLEITPLLMSTSKSFAKFGISEKSTQEKQAGDQDGPFYLGAAVREEFDGKTANLVWYSSSALLNESLDIYVSGGNSDLLLNSLGFLTDHESAVSIRSKSLGATEYLNMTANQIWFWGILILIVLPFASLAIGFVIWLRRRKR